MVGGARQRGEGGESPVEEDFAWAVVDSYMDYRPYPGCSGCWTVPDPGVPTEAVATVPSLEPLAYGGGGPMDSVHRR